MAGFLVQFIVVGRIAFFFCVTSALLQPQSAAIRLPAMLRNAASAVCLQVSHRAGASAAASAWAGPRAATAAVRSFHCTASSVRLAKIKSFDEPEAPPKPSPPVYTHLDTPGSQFVAPEHMRRRDVAYGIGTPSADTAQGKKPRRHVRPYGVQGIPTPMKTYVDGPRELGHTIMRTFIGKVTSDKMNKTIAVEVAQFYKHPKYHKYIKTSKKFLTHDEEEECNIGDVVEIRSCRAFSKRKHFTLHRILKPKLAIEEAAQRFVAHQPSWKQAATAEAADAQQTPTPSTA